MLANALPHGVNGVRGRPFPTPFADPPGVGMSSPNVNLAWSALNGLAALLLLGRGIRTRGEAVAATAGGLAMAAAISYHFRNVRAGGTGLRGLASKIRPDSGPPRGLVAATEPVARALAGRRWFPLWAVLHHRGRKSGSDYATPVAVVPSSDPGLIVIGLPWGPKTNWARNVVAAGRAELTWKGATHEVMQPRIVEADEAATHAKPLFAGVVRRMPAAILLRRSGRT